MPSFTNIIACIRNALPPLVPLAPSMAPSSLQIFAFSHVSHLPFDAPKHPTRELPIGHLFVSHEVHPVMSS